MHLTLLTYAEKLAEKRVAAVVRITALFHESSIFAAAIAAVEATL